ncbi:MAG: PAS domain S-box protein [Proteobacteria bacterium]|nr:PAS domain S-box protein [Pseudomonadota bacterium]
MKKKEMESENNLIKPEHSETAGVPFPEGLSSVLSVIPDIIYRFDYDSRITYISGAVKRYGCQPVELIGKYLPDLVYNADKEKASEWIKEWRTADGNIEPIELRLLTKNQKEIYFKFYCTTVKEFKALKKNMDSSGFIGIQGIAIDISELKRAEEDKAYLSKLQGFLETTRLICHELSQPITVISGYSEMVLLNKAKDDPQYEKLLEIQKQAGKLEEITRKLRYMAKYIMKDDIPGIEIIGERD